MAKYTKEEIIARAKEIAKMIAETEEVDFSNVQKRKFMKMKRLGL